MTLIGLATTLTAAATSHSPLPSNDGRPPGDSRVFARVGEPGHPEGIVVSGGIVYVSTNRAFAGNENGPPSRIFGYDQATGALVRTLVVTGEDLSRSHGILGLALGKDGKLYAADSQGRILRFNLSSGEQQTLATIPDLPTCSTAPAGPCSPTLIDQPSLPNSIVFDGDNNAYISDFFQATIWKVAAGSGLALPWFQDERFDGAVGANGLAVGPSGQTLFVAVTGAFSVPNGGGSVYSLPIVSQPPKADLRLFYHYVEPLAGPDGLLFGKSGRLYVALATQNQVSVLSPDGKEVARWPSPAQAALLDPPYDSPASMALLPNGSLLVTNQNLWGHDPSHWVVHDLFVDDAPLP